jgi:rubrerythrin
VVRRQDKNVRVSALTRTFLSWLRTTELPTITRIMATTKDNLDTAFGGESMANRKYTAWARKADKEGFPVIARLFRATANAETIHALGHLAAMDGIGSTAENVAEAIAGETHEYTEMYPPMLEQAIADNHQAKRMFAYALEIEKVHAELFQKAQEALAQGADLDHVDIYLCPVCGHLELGRPTNSCPTCGLPANKYSLIS